MGHHPAQHSLRVVLALIGLDIHVASHELPSLP